MDLTKDQTRQVESIQADFRKEILQIRSSLLARRIELHDLLRDPTIEEGTIWMKLKEIEGLNRSLEETIIHYQLLVRRILTPDQITSWCAGEASSAIKGWRPEK